MAGEQLEPWRELEGKIVMVTGASSGFGHELCLDLADSGCCILAAARKVDKLSSLCQRINKVSGGTCRAIAVELDIMADGSTIEACVEKAWNAFGHIDALVNNAGVRRGSEVISATLGGGMEQSGEHQLNRVLAGVEVRRSAHARRPTRRVDYQHLVGVGRRKQSNDARRGGLLFLKSRTRLHDKDDGIRIGLLQDEIRVNGIAPGLFKSNQR